MATLTIRNLDEATKEGLRLRAARNGRSMESEARALLDAAVTSMPGHGLGSRIHERYREVSDPPEFQRSPDVARAAHFGE